MDMRELEVTTAKSMKQTIADRYDFDELRAINRDENQRALEPTADIFLDWSEALLKRMPTNWQDYLFETPVDIADLIKESSDILDKIKSRADDSVGSRGAKLSNMTPSIQRIMRRQISSTSGLMFLQMIGDERSSENREILKNSRDTKDEIDKLLTKAEKYTGDLGEMVDASKESTAKIAASGRARVFHLEGGKYQVAARGWLVLTVPLGVGLTVLAFGFALGRFIQLPLGADPSQIASYLFSKLLILATLGAAVTFTAKQYTANRHNAVQNFHRSSALRTYRALLAASRDEAVHDAILQQAAQAIFAPSDTGYSKGVGSYDNSPMVQLVQGLGKGQSSQPPVG